MWQRPIQRQLEFNNITFLDTRFSILNRKLKINMLSYFQRNYFSSTLFHRFDITTDKRNEHFVEQTIFCCPSIKAETQKTKMIFP